MSDDFDWEEWDSSSLSFGEHCIAGCVAGVSEHIVFFPIDTLRVISAITSQIQTNLQATTQVNHEEMHNMQMEMLEKKQQQYGASLRAQGNSISSTSKRVFRVRY